MTSFVTIANRNRQGRNTQTNKQTNSPGGFRAESKTVLGEDRAPRVEASQGFDCPGFIQPNKQTNKQTNKKSGEFSDELDLKLGPQMHVSAKSQSEGTIQYVPDF